MCSLLLASGSPLWETALFELWEPVSRWLCHSGPGSLAILGAALVWQETQVVVCQAGPPGGNRVVLFPDGGSGVKVLLLFFFFLNTAFPSQAREMIIRVL